MVAPSGSGATFCCCSKYFRRARSSTTSSTTSAPKGGGGGEQSRVEVAMNGQRHLQVPHVSIIPDRYCDVVEGGNSSRSSSDDVFETARTSRRTDDAKFMSMKELIRIVRIEEGLEVTPRLDSSPASSSSESQTLPPPQLQLTFNQQQTTIPSDFIDLSQNEPRPLKMRKACFNDDGDITTRTITPRSCGRRVSIVSLNVPSLQINANSPMVTSSKLSRRIAFTPQFIVTCLAFTYSCITTIITSFTNIFFKF